jgi:hypothetical protein
MSRLLCLVSRDRPQLFEYVRQASAAEADVQVILDRRGSGFASGPGDAERRGEPLAGLRDLGCAFVQVTTPD